MLRIITLVAIAGLTSAFLLADDKKPVAKSEGTAKAEVVKPAAKMPKDSCVAESRTCAEACGKCMEHCRHMKMEDLAKLCEVCHHACWMCYHAVSGKTAMAWEICEMCEKLCTECAAMCEKQSDAMIKKCAEECRKCAKACADSRK